MTTHQPVALIYTRGTRGAAVAQLFASCIRAAVCHRAHARRSSLRLEKKDVYSKATGAAEAPRPSRVSEDGRASPPMFARARRREA